VNGDESRNNATGKLRLGNEAFFVLAKRSKDDAEVSSCPSQTFAKRKLTAFAARRAGPKAQLQDILNIDTARAEKDRYLKVLREGAVSKWTRESGNLPG
jgi:hypothetical protein